MLTKTHNNMSDYTQMVKVQPLAGIIALFLLLCLVHPCVCDTAQETVVVFKGGTTEVSSNKGSTAIKKQTPHGFRIPAFVGGVVNDKEFLAVFCKGFYDKSSHDLHFTNLAVRKSYGNYTQWSDAEYFLKTTEDNKEITYIIHVTAVIKEDKIYALATRIDNSNGISTGSGVSTTGREPFMFVGTVKYSEDSGSNGVSITWDTEKSLKNLLQETGDTSPVGQFFGGIGNGVVMKNGTIVLPIQIVNTAEKAAASIVYSSDNGTTWHIGEKASLNTFAGSVVEWGEGKLLFFVRCSGGLRNFFESDDMGTTWKVSPVFSGVWAIRQNSFGAGSQGSVITAPVDEKDVLLFSHPLYNDFGYVIETLQLWVSDGRRIKCVGNISEKGKGDHYGSSVLARVGNHLYSTYDINPFVTKDNTGTDHGEWNRVIAISSLPQLFDDVKSTVRSWRRLDAFFHAKGFPTEWLVGVLGSATTEDAVWPDMYNCVNATVIGGERVDGGFRFNNIAGSGAQWPVSSERQNQVYAFTKKQFTLAATVTIHNAKETEQFELLGASFGPHENNVHFSLGYTHENKWCVVINDTKQIISESIVEKQKEYHVALTLINGLASVYVDGVQIANEGQTTDRAIVIDHFFMGRVETGSESKSPLCTVRNVMLFNQVLKKEEIDQLSNEIKKGNSNKPMPGKEPQSAPQTSKTMLTDKPKAKIDTEVQKVIEKNGDAKSGDQLMGSYHSAALKKQIKSADSAVVLFAFFQFLFFLCSIIVLSGV